MKRRKCTDVDWLRIGRTVCFLDGLGQAQFFSGYRSVKCIRARWKAWKQLYAEGFSFNSIGNASGFDHKTVMFAVRSGRQGGEISPTDLRLFLPTPWQPKNRRAVAIARREEAMRRVA